MKANNLTGEYCQSCAAILDDVQRNHRRVIVLDSQCAAVFSQSGDAARLEEQTSVIPEPPPIPSPKSHEPQEKPEELKPEPKKPEHKPAHKVEHKTFQGRKR